MSICTEANGTCFGTCVTSGERGQDRTRPLTLDEEVELFDEKQFDKGWAGYHTHIGLNLIAASTELAWARSKRLPGSGAGEGYRMN
jgi:hypothetical protein